MLVVIKSEFRNQLWSRVSISDFDLAEYNQLVQWILRNQLCIEPFDKFCFTTQADPLSDKLDYFDLIPMIPFDFPSYQLLLNSSHFENNDSDSCLKILIVSDSIVIGQAW